MRIANALGVPGTSFVHTRAPIVPAPLDPAVVLKGPGAAWLDDRDRDALAQGLRRTRAFTEAGELLGAPRLAESFGPRNPPERNAHQPGYDAALAVRAQLARPGPLRGLARLLEDKFDVLVLRHRFGDPRVLGAACRSGSARLVAVNVGSPVETTRRFALAHELAHQFLDPPDTDQPPGNCLARGNPRRVLETFANSPVCRLVIRNYDSPRTLGRPFGACAR
jgi:hypothetical protein